MGVRFKQLVQPPHLTGSPVFEIDCPRCDEKVLVRVDILNIAIQLSMGTMAAKDESSGGSATFTAPFKKLNPRTVA